MRDRQTQEIRRQLQRMNRSKHRYNGRRYYRLLNRLNELES